MKYNVLLKPFNNKIFYKNKIFEINNGNNIFYGLKKELNKEGIEVNTIDLKTNVEVDFYIYCDLPYPWDILNWLDIIKHPNKNILLIFESPLINPFNHFHFLYPLFKKVYTWDTTIKKNYRINDFRIPQFLQAKSISDQVKKRDYISVFSKKSSYYLLKVLSKYGIDLYKRRLELLKYFENIKSDQFDLYGYGWDKKFDSLANYKGTIGTNKKINTLSQYKYSFVFENCSAPGYITEKIFDCFSAGCVPIYLGAPDVDDFIPKSSFIDIRKFNSYSELLNFTNTISKASYMKYLYSSLKFMKSVETRERWGKDAFLEKLVNEIIK